VAPLVIFVIGLWPVVALGGRHRAEAGPTRFSRAWAIAIPVVTVPFQVVDLVTSFDIGISLPLHLCDLTWVVTTWALWTHHRFPVALSCFWGLTLTTQALVTPSLGEDFPEPRYVAFWSLHLLVVWAAVYLVFGLRLVPSWRDYGTTMVTTLTWAAATYAFNVAADTNYGYLVRKPSSGSILDVLGPWPWYVAAEIVIVAGAWALLTLALQPLGRVRRPSRGSHRPRERSRRS
jgi:hypothetical integral membrane protein (TIGR02206 family)